MSEKPFSPAHLPGLVLWFRPNAYLDPIRGTLAAVVEPEYAAWQAWDAWEAAQRRRLREHSHG